MSTWSNTGVTAYSNLNAGSINPLECIAAFGGSLIYGIELDTGNYYIITYDSSSNTVTKITALGSNPGVITASQRLLLFKGNLYTIVEPAGGPWEVWRYQGGTLWIKVEEIAAVPGGTAQWGHDGSTMFVEAGTTISSIRVTNNGTAWRSVNVVDSSGTPVSPTLALGGGPYKGVGLAVEMTNNNIYVYTGSVFQEKSTITSYTGVDKNFFWRDGPAYGTDGVSWTTISDTTLNWVRNNCAWPIAWYEDTVPNPNDLYVQYWQPGGDFDTTQELIVAAGVAATISMTNFIRLGNGLTFCGVNDTVGGVFWYVRDTNLGGSTYPDEEIYDTGQFYYGRGKLVRRSDSIIPSTNPGGLALVGKKLFAGSNVNNPAMVAYASEPTFDSWTDYTGSLSTTAPIKAFSATPWGDSEDLEGSEEGIEGGFQGGTGGQCS